MRLNVEIKKELYEELVAHAQRLGRSQSDIVRMLLMDWCIERRQDQPFQGIESKDVEHHFGCRELSLKEDCGVDG